MVKFIVAAIWIVAASIGAVFFSFQMNAPKPAAPVEEQKALLGGTENVKTDIMSVPVVRDGRVGGYFLSQLSYTADRAALAKLSLPANDLIIDEVYSYLFSSPDIDFSKTGSIDLDKFRGHVRDAINKRVGEEMIRDVIVEQIDFLSKDEIRDNALRRRAVEMKVPTFGVDPKEAKAHGEAGAGGHGEAAAESHGESEEKPAH